MVYLALASAADACAEASGRRRQALLAVSRASVSPPKLNAQASAVGASATAVITADSTVADGSSRSLLLTMKDTSFSVPEECFGQMVPATDTDPDSISVTDAMVSVEASSNSTVCPFVISIAKFNSGVSIVRTVFVLYDSTGKRPYIREELTVDLKWAESPSGDASWSGEVKSRAGVVKVSAMAGQSGAALGGRYQGQWAKSAAEKIVADINRGAIPSLGDIELDVQYANVSLVSEGRSYTVRKDGARLVFEIGGEEVHSSVATPFSSPSDAAGALRLLMTR